MLLETLISVMYNLRVFKYFINISNKNLILWAKKKT